MTDTRTPQGTIWVCQDCLFAHANGEVSDDRPADLPEVWALWENEPAGSVTMGGAVHGDDGDADECANVDECECEQITFSTSWCGGCGSTLAGDRYAFTYWA